MAEIQITPSGFLPTPNAQQVQVNPGVVNGGVGTLNQNGDNVVQNIEDVIDLNADEGGDGNSGGGATDREAAAQTAAGDVAVRIDYDVEQRQLYVEFVDTRTDTTITSVPRRDAFNVDANALQDRPNEAFVNDGSAAEANVSRSVALEDVPNTVENVARNNQEARLVAETEVEARGAIEQGNDRPNVAVAQARADNAPAETPANIIEEAVPQQAIDRQPVQNATREQIAIIEGL
ncbi:MAG: hypothetical protein K0U39_00190 [Alphaproteobacteria bacterium]|nr:hypothetical protein [Alphaproteobacteria bacterium]